MAQNYPHKLCYYDLAPHNFSILEGPDICNIHVAAYLGLYDIVQLFIEMNVELKYLLCSEKRLPIIYAIRGGHINIVRLLIDEFPDSLWSLNYNNKQVLKLPIYWAAQYGKMEIIRIVHEAYPNGIPLNNEDRNERLLLPLEILQL